MTERIVVSFWMAHAGLAPAEGRGYLDRTRALLQRGGALGGNLIAFGSQLVAFAFDPDSVEEAIGLATGGVRDERKGGEVAWSAGIAEGVVEAVSPGDTRGWLAWGVPLAVSAALARVSLLGGVLVDKSFKALDSLVTLGTRVAKERGRRVRGAVLDVMQPWRLVAAALVARIETPPLTGREDPSALLWMPGALAILRADPGLGGSRLLAELATLVAPGPCLLLSPSGSSLEPLGALRRGLARANALGARHFEAALEPALRRLLAGDGVPIATAAAIIGSFLRVPSQEGPPGALLIDDVTDVDAATVEACGRAAAAADGAFACVVRMDETTAPPASLMELSKGPEMELKPFDDTDGRSFAAQALGGALDAEGQKRWARRGGYTPLGILEALAVSLSEGELGWTEQGARARTRVAGRGAPRVAVQWIARRAQLMGSALEQLILAFVALAGGELSMDRLQKLLAAAQVRASAVDESKKLVLRRWLVTPQPGWVALPTRSHREAILGELSDDGLRGIIHRALANVLEDEERGIGLAEAAHHLAKAGDRTNAARVALACARAAIGLGLGGAATHLVALAREQDPSCEEEARSVLALVVAIPSSGPADGQAAGAFTRGVDGVDGADGEPAMGRRRQRMLSVEDIPTTHDSEPPTMTTSGSEEAAPVSVTVTVTVPPTHPSQSTMDGGVATTARGPSVSPMSGSDAPGTVTEPAMAPVEETTSEDVAERLTELAKEALMGADTHSLERWAEGLLAAGEHGRFAERMQAIVRLSRGDVGEALRGLRTARAELDANASPAERCQTSLALGVALAVAGRPDEALLEALDALARAREENSEKGAHACLAFLSKLYTTVERPEDASRLRRVARIVKDTQQPAAPG